MKHITISAVFLTLLYTMSAFTMNDDSFEVIYGYAHAAKFGGHVVAYKTTERLFGSQKGFIIDQKKDDQLKYGYVAEKTDQWLSFGEGHSLFQILKPNEKNGHTSLVNDNLGNNNVQMRFAHTHEKIALLQALKIKAAIIDSSHALTGALEALESDKDIRSLQKDQKN